MPTLPAASVNHLWTASDEMRMVKCLESRGQGYRLHRQFKLDRPFTGLRGAEEELEADLEAHPPYGMAARGVLPRHGRVTLHRNCGTSLLSQR